jgi:diacylglycerol kinase (ATP)
MRCEWCGITTHSTCRSRVPEECGFGTLRDIIIPPYAISIPRIADLNKDLILGIGNNMSKPMQTTTSQLNNSAGLGTNYIIYTSPDPKSAVSIMKSSSTEHLSGADVDLGSSVGIEREPPSRGTTTFSSPNVQIEPTTSKQRRDKMTNKNQQDEEEEREIIRVYDGNATFRSGTPRSISVPKQATYTQILEAALRTFHINDDSTKYCLTVPTDDVGGDQPLDETMPLKSLKQLNGRKLNIFIRYKERGDMDYDYVRVYPGILKYKIFL